MCYASQDCVCMKRTDGAASVTSVHDYLHEVGLAAVDTAVWAHSRPQPARGPHRHVRTQLSCFRIWICHMCSARRRCVCPLVVAPRDRSS